MTEPTAWVFELAGARVWEDGKPTGWTDWGPPQLSFTKPCVPEGSIRNLRPLTAGGADATALRNALHLFREFVLRNVTQWERGAGVPGHPMWAHIAELVGEMGGIVSGPQYRFIQPDNEAPLADLRAPAADEDTLNDARAILASGLKANGELPGTHEALISPDELDPLESAAVHAIAALLARADTGEVIREAA